ncbi:hypothetical protein [Senegalimassilia anaerobia]
MLADENATEEKVNEAMAALRRTQSTSMRKR